MIHHRATGRAVFHDIVVRPPTRTARGRMPSTVSSISARRDCPPRRARRVDRMMDRMRKATSPQEM